ncbi:hypothetical protein M404DRAFT_999808, partial [Pisolithus tinctorius Marx 270]
REIRREDLKGREKGSTCTTTAGTINTKFREAVEDLRTNRENAEIRRLDHPIVSYIPNPGVPRKGSARGMNNPKSERSDAELRERLRHDLEHGPSHKNANISGATGPI